MAANPGLAGAAAGLSELHNRLLFVLMALLVYRTGTHIPVPGINPERLAALFDQQQGGILDLFNMFSRMLIRSRAPPENMLNRSRIPPCC